VPAKTTRRATGAWTGTAHGSGSNLLLRKARRACLFHCAALMSAVADLLCKQPGIPETESRKAPKFASTRRPTSLQERYRLCCWHCAVLCMLSARTSRLTQALKLCARACSIRKQEDLVLDFWSSENAFKVSACHVRMVLPVCVLCSQQDMASTRAGGRRGNSGIPGFHSSDSAAVFVRHCRREQSVYKESKLRLYCRCSRSSVLSFPHLYTGALVQVARL